MKWHEIAERLREVHTRKLASYAHYMAGNMQRLIQRRDLRWHAALKVLGIHQDIPPATPSPDAHYSRAPATRQ